MASENEFGLGGVKYEAADNPNVRGGCQGCAFIMTWPGIIRTEGCIKSPDCSDVYRQDGRSIIWVKVEDQENEG